MVIKLNIVRLNCASLNHASLNGVGERLRASAGGGGGEVIPPDIPVTYTLSASVENGSVKATVNGVAVTLPYTANEGEVVVMEVTANDGYEFEGWSDGNKSNPRTIIVNEDITLNASCKEVFVPLPTYTLSASVVNGVISATLNGKAISLPYETNEGDVIVLSVTPNDGYAFEGWNDGNTDNPRTITMTADVVLSAQCVEVVQPPVGNYIQFKDKAVEAICVANWSSDGIGLTEEDAAAVTSIGRKFMGNTEITSFNELRFFTGVTSLSFAAFSGCSNLATIDLSNITEIKAEAFRNCTELSIEVIIPNVANILKQTFVNTKITKLVAENIVTIESSAFGSCANLKEVDLGISVQSIGWGAFSGCSALESVVVRATTPPSLAAEAFKFSTCPIYVPDASLEAYRTAINWNTYADRIHPLSEIEGDNGVTLYDRLYGDGVAYIATDYYLKGNEMIESVQQNIFIDSANRALWGAVGTKAKTYCTTGGASNSAYMQYVFYYGATSLTTYQNVNVSNYSQFRIKFTAGYLQIADRDYTIGGSRVAIDAPFHIFAKANDSAFWQGWIGQVVLSDENTSEVLAKFTPASYNGEAGMYDEVSGKFYGNAATSGAFYVENE